MKRTLLKKYVEHVYYGYLMAIFLTVLDIVMFHYHSFSAYLKDYHDVVIYRFTLFPFIWAVITLVYTLMVLAARQTFREKE